jgi:hypothetical protein
MLLYRLFFLSLVSYVFATDYFVEKFDGKHCIYVCNLPQFLSSSFFGFEIEFGRMEFDVLDYLIDF